jgi:hypothetical protein
MSTAEVHVVRQPGRSELVPHLDYGASGDREIQPVSNMRKRNVTLDHFDCGISQP